MATCLLPVVHEMAILDIDHNRAHLLCVFADDFLLFCILIQQLCHCDMRAEEILIDGVLILLKSLSSDRRLLLGRSMLEIAVLDVTIASKRWFPLLITVSFSPCSV